MLVIRPAVRDDIEGIMNLEIETFEPVGDGAMASRDLMLSRINLCNSIERHEPDWFWVADYDGKIVGDMILQPTHMQPENCISWNNATDNGTLVKTFNRHGNNIYGVSLAVSHNFAPSGTTELLIHKLMILWIKHNMKRFFICSRMPGYKKANEETGVTAENYWRLRCDNGKPADWMLRLFSEMIGVKPVRLLVDGFIVDEDSGGHGVLCVNDDPIEILDILATRIYNEVSTIGIKEDK